MPRGWGGGATSERIPGRDGHGDHLIVYSPWGDRKTPGILLMSHLDTVHPKGTIEADLPIRIEGDEAYGPGICDMKGGAYNALAALRAVAESGITPPLPVRILYTSDEEVGSPTSRALTAGAPTCRARRRRARPARPPA